MEIEKQETAEQKTETNPEIKVKLKTPLLPYLVIAAVVLAVIITASIILSAVFSRPGQMLTTVESSLVAIKETESMSTVEYNYNSVVVVKDEDSKKEKTLYCVSYDGVIKAGFNFADIKIEDDRKNQKYVLIIPEITLQPSEVEYESMEFIFIEGKDKEGLAKEAYPKCKADLEEKAKNEESVILEIAKESAKNTMELFLKPFEKDLKGGYEFEIRFAEGQK